jgi:hypothetical protein
VDFVFDAGRHARRLVTLLGLVSLTTTAIFFRRLQALPEALEGYPASTTADAALRYIEDHRGGLPGFVHSWLGLMTPPLFVMALAVIALSVLAAGRGVRTREAPAPPFAIPVERATVLKVGAVVLAAGIFAVGGDNWYRARSIPSEIAKRRSVLSCGHIEATPGGGFAYSLRDQLRYDCFASAAHLGRAAELVVRAGTVTTYYRVLGANSAETLVYDRADEHRRVVRSTCGSEEVIRLGLSTCDSPDQMGG